MPLLITVNLCCPQVRPGNGPVLPGMARAAGHPMVGAALAAAPIAVGAPVPSPPFPNTTRDVAQLSKVQLHMLAVMYNDSFEILPNDNLQIRRDKLKAWLLGK